MRSLILGLIALVGTTALAKPECTIDFARVTNSLGVVAGHAKGDSAGPVYVTVKNADLAYTTLADDKGNWAVTFRYFSTQVTAEAWQAGRNNRSMIASHEMKEGETE